jgi:hypothetical protein
MPRLPLSSARIEENEPMTINPELVTATDLAEAADRLEAGELTPRLVRRLLTRTAGVEGVTMRATEGIRLGGWDGEVAASAGSAYVPSGSSAWEIGTGQNPKGKADEDYEKRTREPRGVNPANTAFVFVTARRWAGKNDWVAERAAEGVWREVRSLDADDLHGWLEANPGVHIWISEQLGRRPAPRRRVGAAAGPRLLRLLERALDPVGDEVERRASVHFDRLARVMRDHEHVVVVRRVVSPPALPLAMAPVPAADGTKHVAPHHASSPHLGAASWSVSRGQRASMEPQPQSQSAYCGRPTGR